MGSCYHESCADEARIVIIYEPILVQSCEDHYDSLYKRFLKARRRQSAVNLHQVVDQWVKPDGSTGKITAGKSWEIGQRTISPDDGRTVYNKVTGKKPEY